MYVKVACVGILTLCQLRNMIPPHKSSPTDTAKDIAKMDVQKFMWIYKNVTPTVTVLMSAAYVYLMKQGKIPTDVQPWHYASVVIGVVSTMFRWWSYKELDRFFTFDLKLMDDHKLVQTGPYKYLIHPSYLGMVAASTAYHTFLIAQGFWEVMTPSRYHGPLVAPIFATYWAAQFFLALIPRMRAEEKMMSEHFGKAWKEFTKCRWRVVPFVY
ncbi:hypothetical protein BGZ73_003192 [Actinomortierella ambigua]|nr:hypothetical protein BGZ73_003192 [Actinomortierella ambigua]